MDFRTEFKVEPFNRKITYNDKLLFLGSCFAENISSYFHKYRFQVKTNPFGILYHPLAIDRIVDIAQITDYNPEEYSFQFQEIWSNYDAHSLLSSVSKQQLIDNLKTSKNETEVALRTYDVIFISLGTAWIYKLIEQDKVVANCHKLPQKHFKKQLLETSQVKSALEKIITKIQAVNPNVQIIFTLSPVRHLKDGFIENQMSKSTLYLAIQECIQIHNNTSYFPSYELLLDDLRDYRFYSRDMLHPNNLAIDYIWEKLCNAIFRQETFETLEKVKAIDRRLNHRFFNPDSASSKIFKEKTDQLIKSLSTANPHLKF